MKATAGSIAKLNMIYSTRLPITLNHSWINAERFASFVPEKEVMRAVDDPPILHPRIMYRHMGRVKRFCCAISRTMLTTAEEDCITAVNTNPTSTATIGCSNELNSSITCGLSCRPLMAEDMVELADENDMILICTPYSMFKTCGILYDAGMKPLY